MRLPLDVVPEAINHQGFVQEDRRGWQESRFALHFPSHPL